MIRTFLTRLVGRLGSRRPNVSPSRDRSFQPTLDALEDRSVPAAISWTGGGDGTSWGDMHNWSPMIGPGGIALFRVPGVNDDVTINVAANIHMPAAVTVQSLTVTGNNVTISGAGSLMTLNLTFSSANGSFMTNADITVTCSFDWTAGSFGGSGDLNLQCVSTLNGGGNILAVFNRDVINEGTATWTSGNIELTGASISNIPGATFSSQGGYSMTGINGTETFDNAGTFYANNPTVANLTTIILCVFNNTPVPGGPTPTVEANAATIEFDDDGTHSGAVFTTSNLGLIQFDAGTQTLTNGTTFTGSTLVTAGDLNVPAGNTITNTGTFQLTANGYLTGSGSTVGVDGEFQNSGTFLWNGGDIGTLIFDNLASMTLAGGTKYLDRSLFGNWGYMEWDAGNFAMLANAGNCDLWNFGTFVIQANNCELFDRSRFGFTNIIDNATDPNNANFKGVVKIQGGATTTIDATFINDAGATLNQGVSQGIGDLIIPFLVNNPGSTDIP